MYLMQRVASSRHLRIACIQPPDCVTTHTNRHVPCKRTMHGCEGSTEQPADGAGMMGCVACPAAEEVIGKEQLSFTTDAAHG